MIPVKILCHCGTKYAIEIPEDAALPDGAILCPKCGIDGTPAARQILNANQPTTPAEPEPEPEPVSAGLSIATASAPSAETAPPPPRRVPPGGHARRQPASRVRQEREQSSSALKWTVLSVAAAFVLLCAFWVTYKFYLIKPKVIYSKEFDRGERPVVARLLDEQSLVLVENRSVSLVDLGNGEAKWTFSLPGTVVREEDELPDWYEVGDGAFSLPELLLTENTIWVSWAEKTVCLDPASGTVKKEFEFGDSRTELGSTGNDVVLVQQGPDDVTTVEILDETGNQRREHTLEKGDVHRQRVAVDGNALVQLSTKLLQSNHVPVSKPFIKEEAREKVELNENLTAAKSLGATLTMLDEMRAQDGLDDEEETEDRSIYEFTLARHEGSSKKEWKGEIVGPPLYFPLDTFDVVFGIRSVKVFDKNCRLKWEADMSAPVSNWAEEVFFFSDELHPSLLWSADGIGGYDRPCLETESLLLIADAEKVTAFDKASGEVRWRVTAAGARQMFVSVDGGLLLCLRQEMKASGRQGWGDFIDILMCVKPDNGEVLWSEDYLGYGLYPSGKRLYSLWVGVNEGSMMGMMYGNDESMKARSAVGSIDGVTGDALWKKNFPSPPTTVDAINNRVLVQFQKNLEVIDYFAF